MRETALVDEQIPDTARILGLARHPEGGWYGETWRSDVIFEVPGRGHERPSGTAIYFLLTPGDKSRWHVVRSDELWFWHAGGPIEMVLNAAGPDSGDEAQSITLGPDVRAGQRPQVLVPGGIWQTARPAGDHEVLVSCVVCPGFDFDDFTLA
ncbi:cupin domain-containing protein [Mycobacteroides chelonae]|uniref:cupin domain-containing protein n=1 Tax=Mycobacteroides chelonae TaxID=1774 RepID=UPI0007B43671|nr:cupin domain-containing protein [Mycobacteroides chelonae]ANA97711.1 cupin [Mycobacteroides chelonae CCUG 47445]